MLVLKLFYSENLFYFCSETPDIKRKQNKRRKKDVNQNEATQCHNLKYNMQNPFFLSQKYYCTKRTVGGAKMGQYFFWKNDVLTFLLVNKEIKQLLLIK